MTVEFELLRLEATPASAAVAVVELDGRFAGVAPARVRLLVERGDAAIEVPALAAGGDDVWTASFAVELAALDDPATQWSLAPGRGPLIALPAPSVTAGAGDDRFVRLARQANELRHRLNEAVAASAAREDLNAELATERDTLREALADAERRLADVEERAKAARDQRDSATASADEAREQLAELRTKLREADARATDAERDRAALRARADAAERTAGELREQTTAAAEQATELEARATAAEDELRLARRDLRDARARVEALQREARAHEHAPARRGHEVAEEPEPDPEPEPEQPEPSEELTVVVDEEPGGDEPPTDVVDDDTAPAKTITRTRRIVRIADEPDAADQILKPEAVGARYIEPAETPSRLITPERIIVGVVLLLIIAALVAIVLGAGLV